MSVLDMIVNCIWSGGSSCRALGSAKYLFIAIIPMSTLIESDSTKLDPICGAK